MTRWAVPVQRGGAGWFFAWVAGGLAAGIAMGLWLAVSISRHPSLWGKSAADAPWIATTGVQLVGSLAIVVAAVAGSSFAGKWAYRSQQEQLERELAAADRRYQADREDARERDRIARERLVADKRAERLREAYSEFVRQLSLVRVMVAKIHNERTIYGNMHPTKELEVELQEMAGPLSAALSMMELAATPAILLEVLELERVARLLGEAIINRQPYEDHYNALRGLSFGLTIDVLLLVKDLDEGKAPDMAMPPIDELDHAQRAGFAPPDAQ